MEIPEHYRQLIINQDPSVTDQKAADLMCTDMLRGLRRLLIDEGERVPMFGRNRNLIKGAARVIISTMTTPIALLAFSHPFEIWDHKEWVGPRSMETEGSIKISSQSAATRSRFFMPLKVRIDGLSERLSLECTEKGETYGAIDKLIKIRSFNFWMPNRRANLDDATKFWEELANYLPAPK